MGESNFFKKTLDCCCIRGSKSCLQPKNCDEIFLDDTQESSDLLIDNPTQLEFYKVKVDGCLFKKDGPGKRCDWAVYSESYDRLLLVELKKRPGFCRTTKQLATTACFFGQPYRTLCVLVHKRKNAQRVINALEERNLIAKSIQRSTVSAVHESQDFIELLTYRMPKAGSR